MKVLIATTNEAKIKSYGSKLRKINIEYVTLKDINLSCDVKEDGTTPIENAIIKAKNYSMLSSLPTLAIDDGLYFENIPDNLQPGTNVRRINGKRLNDEEMINHYINMVNTYGKDGLLQGYFLKGIAICFNDKTYTFENKGIRTFTNKKSDVIITGYPLESIQIVPKFNKFKSELTDKEKEAILTDDQKDIIKFLDDTLNNLI